MNTDAALDPKKRKSRLGIYAHNWKAVPLAINEDKEALAIKEVLLTTKSEGRERVKIQSDCKAIVDKINAQEGGECQQTSEDVISILPDDILVRILSSLSLKEAGRTSILSKPWTKLWTNIIELDFDGEKVSRNLFREDDTFQEREKSKYVEWVNEVLKLHDKDMVLDRFRICFHLEDSYREQIDEWLQYASARKVHNLELDLLAGSLMNCYHFKPYTLCLNSGKSYVDYFKSLKTLSLKNVNVSEEVVQFFLHKCPFLERLIVFSISLKTLEVSGSSLALKYLHLKFHYPIEYVKICNINLVSLITDRPESLVLENVPMLVDVKIHGRSAYIVRDAISWLSGCLSNLEVLTLSTSWCQEREYLLDLPQLPKLKQLTLNLIRSYDYSLLGFTSLIRASPNLEKFVLINHLQPWADVIRRNGRNKNLEKALSYTLQHLKVVELRKYWRGKSEVELVHYFLENAAVLEKIIVDVYIKEQPVHKQLKKEKRFARYKAKKQLQKFIPSHVEFVIL